MLPIAVGKATKLFDKLALKRKKYRAKFKFGTETETGDTEGAITKSGRIPDKDEILNALHRFTGKIMQTPHNYSAIKIGGKKACDMARQGIMPQLKSREIEIYKFELFCGVSADEYIFDIECSAGTYIRSLCKDLAGCLNTVACMTMLIRLCSGAFDIKDSITLEEIEEKEDFNRILLPVTYPLSNIKSISADSVCYDKIYNGVPIEYDDNDENEVLVYCREEFFGIGEIKNGLLKVCVNLKQYD